MSKREFYVCDGVGAGGTSCGVILVGDDDGRIIQGTIKKPNDTKPSINSGDGERALCKTCLLQELGLGGPGKAST